MHTAPWHSLTKKVKRVRVLLVCIAIAQTGLWLGAPSPVGAESLLPGSSEIPGWRLSGSPYHYGPRDLFEYIDGEADFFLAYGFVELSGATYELASDPKQFVTVDVYDMGQKLNAFGVYQAKRNPSLPSMGVGAASEVTDGYASFYKDRYYIEIVSVTQGDERKQQHVLLARKVAGKIEGDPSPPAELTYLPEGGKVEGSEKYVIGGILGHSFLHRGLVCRYERGGEEVSAFIAFYDTPEEAARSQDQHRAFLEDSGKTWSPLTFPGAGGFVSSEPHHDTIAQVRKGAFLIGVFDVGNPETGKGLLLEMLQRIERLGRRG